MSISNQVPLSGGHTSDILARKYSQDSETQSIGIRYSLWKLSSHFLKLHLYTNIGLTGIKNEDPPFQGPSSSGPLNEL